jgi:hypothetical protein
MDGREGPSTMMMVTRHESATSPPNLRLRSIGHEGFEQVTHFTDPRADPARNPPREPDLHARRRRAALGRAVPPAALERRTPADRLVGLPRRLRRQRHGVPGQRFEAPFHAYFRAFAPCSFALQGYEPCSTTLVEGRVVGSPETMNGHLHRAGGVVGKSCDREARSARHRRPRRAVGVRRATATARSMTACLLAHTARIFKAGIARQRRLQPHAHASSDSQCRAAHAVGTRQASYLKLSPFPLGTHDQGTHF